MIFNFVSAFQALIVYFSFPGLRPGLYIVRPFRPLKNATARYFTLLEILIVLLILSVVAGLIGFNATKMMREQRFKSAVEWINDKIQTATNIMSVFNSDITLILEHDAKKKAH